MLTWKDSANFRAFVWAFWPQWFTAMSGPLTVPFAFVAFFVENNRLKALFGLLALTCAAFSAYWVWRVERQRAIALERRLEPKLQVVFATGSPFEMESAQPASGVPGTIHFQRFRIGVKNASGTTIDHVGVDVVDIEPHQLRDSVQLPLPLLAMHNLSEPIDPEQVRTFDVVSRGYYTQPPPATQGGASIEVCNSAVAGLCVPLQSFQITLQVHGANVPPHLQKIAVRATGLGDPLSFSLDS